MCKIGRISDGQWMEESFRGSTAACDCQYDGQCDGDADGIPELAMQRNRAKISWTWNGTPTLIKYAASRYPVSHAPFMHGVGPSRLPSPSASSWPTRVPSTHRPRNRCNVRQQPHLSGGQPSPTSLKHIQQNRTRKSTCHIPSIKPRAVTNTASKPTAWITQPHARTPLHQR